MKTAFGSPGMDQAVFERAIRIARETSIWARLSRSATVMAWPLQEMVTSDRRAFNSIMRLCPADFHYLKQERSVGRCELKCPDGPQVVYLKRYLKASSPWKALLSAIVPSSDNLPAFSEWGNHLRANTCMLPVAQVVAAGECFGPWLRHQSLIAIKELEGMLPLHEAVAEAARIKEAPTFRIWKYSVAREVGRLVNLLHHRGYFHKDLYLSHFFCPMECVHTARVRQGDIHLIDLHRLRRHPWLGLRWKVHDLAQLLYSSEMLQIDRRDRLCFMRGYSGGRKTLRRKLSLLVRLQAWHFRNHNARMLSAAQEVVR
jgi:hypothetical protein